MAEAVSSPVQTVNKVVMSYKNWKAVRDEAYISNPQLAGRMDAMFDARVGANAAFMVVSGGTASAIVRPPAAAKVVKSARNLSKKGLTLVYINGKLKLGPSSLPSSALKAPVPIVRKAEAPSGKAVPVGEARIPQSPQAVKGTTVTLAQEQRLNDSGRTIGKSKSQNQIMQDDVAYLRSMGAEDIRINQQQVNNQMCRVGICRPDVQATLPNSNKRIYIEYDRTSSNRGAGHASRALSNDPDAIVILRTVD